MDENALAGPVLHVRGVIDASGAAGASSGGGTWNLIYHFAAWRISDASMQRRPRMRLLQVVPKADLSRLMKEVRPFTVWNVLASVAAEPSPQGWLLARVAERIGTDTADAELAAVAEELQRPVVVDDLQFGPLKLDRRINAFTSEADWNGTRVGLTLPVDREAAAPAAEVLAAARTLWADSAAWQRRVNTFAIERLLPLKNETWLDDGQTPLTPADFLRRMRLETVEFEDSADGRFTFWHDDGGLFCGHSIQITGTFADGPIHADIPG